MHPGSAGVPNREPRTKNREPRAPWVRGRLARIRAILSVPGSAGVPPACARPRRVPGARASRTKNQEPGTRNREPRASWVRGRPARIRAILRMPGARASPSAYAQSCASLGARASRPHVRDPGACQERGRLARIRAILRVPGCAGVPPACAQSQRLKFCPCCSIMTVNENQAQAC